MIKKLIKRIKGLLPKKCNDKDITMLMELRGLYKVAQENDWDIHEYIKYDMHKGLDTYLNPKWTHSRSRAAFDKFMKNNYNVSYTEKVTSLPIMLHVHDCVPGASVNRANQVRIDILEEFISQYKKDNG